MRTLLTLSTICVTQFCAAVASANPGPCTQEIAQIERIISTTRPTTQQTVDSQLHRQPTPQSVENAATKARADIGALLARAKMLDEEGNASDCMNVVSRIRIALGQ